MILLLILITLILITLVYLLLTKKNKENFINNKIINLVLYSNNEQYNEMYKLTKKYYKSFEPNVKTIYYRFNDKITNEYELNDDILEIKGTESYIPGILDKTIKAFEYINKYYYYNYNYIIRSNISTIINFNLLQEKLNTNNIEYGGVLKWKLEWIDVQSGITDKSLFGTIYPSGTGIILSNKSVNLLLNNKDKINYNIIDDVAIGSFFHINFKDIKTGWFDNQFLFVPDFNGDKNKLIEFIKSKPNIIAYRNRNNNREIDVKQMDIIINYLETPT